jgi:hypothetical protein
VCKFQRGDEEEVKSKFQRGDTAGKFQRGNLPPDLCFVCHKRITALEKLKEARENNEFGDLHIKMQGVVAEKVVRLIHKGVQIFRHADGCEPGSPRYMKNPKLAKSYKETFDN